jgi:hypothetical protein
MKALIAPPLSYLAWATTVMTMGCSDPSFEEQSSSRTTASSDGDAIKVARRKLDGHFNERRTPCDGHYYLLGISRAFGMMCYTDGKPLKQENEQSVMVEARFGFNDVDGPLSGGDRISRRLGNYDWARGRRKVECPLGYVAVGMFNHPYVRGSKKDTTHFDDIGLLCSKASARVLETDARAQCETLWFDRGQDHRPPQDGSPRDTDFDPYALKGQCKADQYVAGMAYFNRYTTIKWGRPYSATGYIEEPNAILCCSLSTP